MLCLVQIIVCSYGGAGGADGNLHCKDGYIQTETGCECPKGYTDTPSGCIKLPTEIKSTVEKVQDVTKKMPKLFYLLTLVPIFFLSQRKGEKKFNWKKIAKLGIPVIMLAFNVNLWVILFAIIFLFTESKIPLIQKAAFIILGIYLYSININYINMLGYKILPSTQTPLLIGSVAIFTALLAMWFATSIKIIKDKLKAIFVFGMFIYLYLTNLSFVEQLGLKILPNTQHQFIIGTLVILFLIFLVRWIGSLKFLLSKPLPIVLLLGFIAYYWREKIAVLLTKLGYTILPNTVSPLILGLIVIALIVVVIYIFYSRKKTAVS